VVQGDNKPSVTVNHPSTSFGLFNHAEGMRLRTPVATLDGQGYQISNIDSSGFSFRGVADVFASSSFGVDYQPDYMETSLGNASGNAATQILFAGNHNFYSARNGGGNYALTGDNGFAWDDQGDSSFSAMLNLVPGTYTFNVSLYAAAYASYDDTRGGRAAACAAPEVVCGLSAHRV
jgi:hypothetical protein